MDALLNVERRRVDDEVGPVLQVLAAPDELGVEVAVAALVGDLEGDCSSCCMRGWCSALGRFLRLASLWRIVSTCFFLFDFGLAI
ncbi:MAG: hypothetical protein OXF62_06285 [Caldilineaceae bacterium]|nr:hypothetical protein [Caldilineaceae bacterium]